MNMWTLILLCAMFGHCSGSGYFEIQIISMENIRGELSNGTCCGSREYTYTNSTCSGECATYIRICLKQYQAQVTVTGHCTFGNRTTRVLGGNSFRQVADNTAAAKLPFKFSWTVRC